MKQQCVGCSLVKDISAFEWQKNRPNPRKKCQQCRHDSRNYEKEYTYRNKKRKEKYWADPDKARQEWEKHKYGVCKEDFSYSECWICSSSKRLCIDHCHSSGEPRGLLCTKCNSAIGMFEDSIDKMIKAVEYLSDGPHFELDWKKYPK